MDDLQLLNGLVGRTVSFVRLATNSLLVYLECEPGDRSGYVVWLEPTWHARGPEAVLAGSRQAQVDPDSDEDEGAILDAVGHALDPFLGCKVTSVHTEPITNDLVVRFEGGYELRTFVSDPTDDHSWHISDNARGESIYGSPSGLRLRKKAPK